MKSFRPQSSRKRSPVRFPSKEHDETFEKCFPLKAGFEFREGESFNHPREIGISQGTAWRHLRQAGIHWVFRGLKVEHDVPPMAGAKGGRFAKVS
jgi:hypothetical protein